MNRSCTVLLAVLAACSAGGGRGDGGGGSGGGGGGPTAFSPYVDPESLDGQWSETLPDPSADIADLVSGYSPSGAAEFVLDVLERRYPVGAVLVEKGRERFDCVSAFLADTSTAERVIRQLSTVVHECGHMFDLASGGGRSNTYVITQDVTITCADGDARDRGGLTFARKDIVDDRFSERHPPCRGGGGRDCDFYADIYLDAGSSGPGGGEQGFNMLLEEAVQYVNSLAVGLAFTQELAGAGSVSERDGILTFLWYVGRYLHLARTEHPDAYEHLRTGDGGCWRDAILTVWGRAWLYLESTKDMPHLGLADDLLAELATDPELLAEIQRLRDAE